MSVCDFEIHGDYRIEQITELDFDAVRAFLAYDFMKNELLCKSLKLHEVESSDMFNGPIHLGIESMQSYMIKDKTGIIVAVRLADIFDRKRMRMQGNTESERGKDREARKIWEFLDVIDAKIWDYVGPEIDCLLHINIISVDNKKARCGLATKLITYKLNEVKELGMQGCVASATCIESQRLFKKHGFEVLYEFMYKDWLDMFGKQIFNYNGQTQSTQMMFKKLG